MMCSSRDSLRICVILLALVSGCAKGGTSLDAESADSPAAVDDDEGSSGRDGDDSSSGDSGSGASGTNGGGGSGAQMPCGNGALDSGEDCDGSNLNGVTCVNLGFSGGDLTCDPTTCTFETSMCTRDMSMGTAGMGP